MTQRSERRAPHLRAILHLWLSLTVYIILPGTVLSAQQRLPVGDGASVVTSALMSADGSIYATSVNQLYRRNDAGVMERIPQANDVVEVRLYDANGDAVLAHIVRMDGSLRKASIALTTDGVSWNHVMTIASGEIPVSAVMTNDEIAVVTVSTIDPAFQAILMTYPLNGGDRHTITLPLSGRSGVKVHRKATGIVISGYVSDDTLAVFGLTDTEPYVERRHPESRRVLVPTGDIGGPVYFHGSGDTLAVDGMPSRSRVILPEGASEVPYELFLVDTTVLLEAAGRFLVSTDGATWTRMVKRPARFTEQSDEALYANDSVMLFSQRGVGLWTYRRDSNAAMVGPSGMQSSAGFVMGKAGGHVLLANSIVDGRYAVEMWKPEDVTGSRRIIHTDAYVPKIFSTPDGAFVSDPVNGLREVNIEGASLEPRGLAGRTITSVAVADGVRLAAADGRLYGQRQAVSDDWALVDIGEGQPMDMVVRNDTAYVVMRVVDHEEGLQSYMLAVVDLRTMTEALRYTLVRDGDGVAFHWMVGTDSTLVVYVGTMLLSSRNGGESWGADVTEIEFAGVPAADGTGWCVPCRNATSIGICVSADAETWYGHALDIPDVDKGIAVISASGYAVGTIDGVYVVTGPLTSVEAGDPDGRGPSDGDLSGPGTVTIVDMRGNIVLREHLSLITRDHVASVTSGLDTGLYVCVVDNGVRRVIRKVVNYR